VVCPDGGAKLEALKAEFPTAPVYDLQFIKRSHDLVIATHGRGLFVLDNITALEELTPDVVVSDFHMFSTCPAQIRVRPRRSGVARRASRAECATGAVIDYYSRPRLDSGASGSQGRASGGGRSRRGAWSRPSRTAAATPSSSIQAARGSRVNRFVWNLRHAGPTRLSFERPTSLRMTRIRSVMSAVRVRSRDLHGTVTAAAARQRNRSPSSPIRSWAVIPPSFAAQLRAGLEWRNAMSALNEMLNRIASLETQLKNTQQALRDNTTGDTATAAPVLRQARDLSRKLKELKDSL